MKPLRAKDFTIHNSRFHRALPVLAAGIRQQRDMPFRALVKPDTLPRLRGAPLVMTIQLLVALCWQEGSKEGSGLVSHDNKLG